MINREQIITGRAGSSVQVDEGLRQYMLRVYNYMVAGLGVTGIIAWYIASSEQVFQSVLPYISPLSLALVAMSFGFAFFAGRMSLLATQLYFFAFAGLMGVVTSAYFAIYTNESIARAFFMASALFGGMSLYGYTTKKDLSSWGSLLFIGMIAVIIVSLVNVFFFKSTAAELAISALVVMLSAGITAYSTQGIREMYYSGLETSKLAVMGALNLYVNFINMFLAILRLVGNQRS